MFFTEEYYCTEDKNYLRVQTNLESEHYARLLYDFIDVDEKLPMKRLCEYTKGNWYRIIEEESYNA